jgi:hypothetical protein
VADDGVYVTINDAQLATTGSEILLKVLVLWNGKYMPVGYEREVFVRKVGGKWVVSRNGVAAVFSLRSNSGRPACIPPSAFRASRRLV